MREVTMNLSEADGHCTMLDLKSDSLHYPDRYFGECEEWDN